MKQGLHATMGLRKAKKIEHQGRKLAEILALHEKFHRRMAGGERADLSGADLSRADLTGVNLTDAILRGANLEESDLRRAKLTRAQLTCPKLHQAYLRNTD